MIKIFTNFINNRKLESQNLFLRICSLKDFNLILHKIFTKINTNMDLQIGDKFSTSKQITDSVVRAFAELSGDYNPIHLDDEFA